MSSQDSKMAAPSIPNLLSLRGHSRGGRGRGRGHSRGGNGGPTSVASQEHDALIQGTDTDAAVSRLSAVELGYLDDPFARFFVPVAGPPSMNRRMPIINRGMSGLFQSSQNFHYYPFSRDEGKSCWMKGQGQVSRKGISRLKRLGTYTRTTALDVLVALFLESHAAEERVQIVSLGAGTDTRSFRLFSQRKQGVGWNRPRIVYHEIDFPGITAKKLRTVQGMPALRQMLPAAPVADDYSSWYSCNTAEGNDDDQLWCHGVDLRQLAKEERQRASQGTENANDEPSTEPHTTFRGLRTDIPTILISECCLCYLSPEDASSVIAWFRRHLSPAQPPSPSAPSPLSNRNPGLGIILYEATSPDDAFGRVMQSNLAARGLRMPTLEAFRSPQDQETRLLGAGFGAARYATVDQIWDSWLSADEKERVDALEGLDEVEEWRLLAAHYVVAWAWDGDGFAKWAAFGT